MSDQMQGPQGPQPAAAERNRMLRHRGAVAGGVLALGLVTWGGIELSSNDGNGGDGRGDGKISEATINALTIKNPEIDCEVVASRAKTVTTFKADDGNIITKAEVGALKSVGKGANERRWSDAMNSPMVHRTANEIMATVCEDPLMGATLAHMFANMEIGDVNVGDLNDWLKPYQGKTDKINDLATNFVPHAFMSKEEVAQNGDKVLKAVNDYEALAEKLNTLLTRFRAEGVDVRMTSTNYHLAAGGLVVGRLPEVELNPDQYKGKFLVFVLDEKDGDCLKVVVFNDKDQRPGTVTCEVRPKKAKVSVPVDKTQPPADKEQQPPKAKKPPVKQPSPTPIPRPLKKPNGLPPGHTPQEPGDGDAPDPTKPPKPPEPSDKPSGPPNEPTEDPTNPPDRENQPTPPTD